MVCTNKFLLLLVGTWLLCFSHVASAGQYSVLATHDQNPLLTPYWVPHSINPTGNDELQVSTSLFVTNTLHDEINTKETLTIDAETYRLDVNFQYEYQQWTYHLQVPLIGTQGGFMDEFIIKWHDTFGLPQGQRLNHPNDQVNFQYRVNNTQVIQSSLSYNGIGDLSLVATHPFFATQTNAWHLGVGLNIPSGESSEFISNQRLDTAFWISYLPTNKPFLMTFGFIKPGNGGLFKDRLESSVMFAQTGFEVPFSKQIKAQLQLDYHSAFINSNTTALGQSLQVQIGLHLTSQNIWDTQIFISEDILVGSAPDITFGLQFNWTL